MNRHSEIRTAVNKAFYEPNMDQATRSLSNEVAILAMKHCDFPIEMVMQYGESLMNMARDCAATAILADRELRR